MFVLDTDHFSILQRQTQPGYGRLGQRMSQQPRTAFYVSIISFHEQALGANAYINQGRTAQRVVRGYQLFEQILVDLAAAQVLPFDAAAAGIFDSLRSQRVRIGTMDLRIASVALARQMTVLTRNGRDFCQVPGLRIEDWTT
jgi:tRNA(fMet)-specific endonuclease VapC